MANVEVLQSDKHRNLRVLTGHGARFGENIPYVPVVVGELLKLAVNYPICLMNSGESDRLRPYALLGFEPGENLFLEGDRWDASYVPIHVNRQPFMVGFPDDGTDATPENAVITIDMDSPRVQESEGEALFDDDGSHTPYLKGIGESLGRLINAEQATKAFVDALETADLIKPAELSITLRSGEQRGFDGLFTVDEKRLAELTGDELENLHKRGLLQASYLLLASVGNIQKMVRRKSDQLNQLP